MNLHAIKIPGWIGVVLFMASCGDLQQKSDKGIEVAQDMVGEPIEGNHIVGEPILSGNETSLSMDDENQTIIEEGFVANGKRLPLDENNYELVTRMLPTSGKIIPEYFHKFFVYLSGFFEIYFGLLILFKEERRFGSWGLIALLICVFPANLYLSLSEQARESFSIAVGNNEPIRMVDALIRIPFQIPLILCAYWYTLDKPKRWFSYLCIILFIPTIYYFVNL